MPVYKIRASSLRYYITSIEANSVEGALRMAREGAREGWDVDWELEDDNGYALKFLHSFRIVGGQDRD